MTSDRETLAALVWRRMPAELKVAASGMKFVSVAGKLVRLDSLAEADLFGVLRRANTVKTITMALEAA